MIGSKLMIMFRGGLQMEGFFLAVEFHLGGSASNRDILFFLQFNNKVVIGTKF